MPEPGKIQENAQAPDSNPELGQNEAEAAANNRDLGGEIQKAKTAAEIYRAGMQAEVQQEAKAFEAKLDVSLTENMDSAFMTAALAATDAVQKEFDHQYKSINHNADFTANFKIEALKASLVTLTNSYYAQYLAASSDQSKAEDVAVKFSESLEIRKKAIVDSLKKLGSVSGYIDISRLAELDRHGLKLAKLLSSEEYADLLDAYVYANDQSHKRPELVSIMNKYVSQEYPNGPLLPIVWFVFDALSPTDRVKTAIDMKGKGSLDGPEFQKFLEAGNTQGAFSLDEMEEIHGDKFSTEQREKYDNNYKTARDLKKSIKNLEESYGSYNAAGEMLTGAKIAGAVLDAGLILMGVANLGVGIWKDPIGVWKNEYILISAAGTAARHLSKKPEPLRVTAADKKDRETWRRHEAIVGFREQTRNTLAWEQWDGFFKADDYKGLELFSEFRDYLLSINDGKMPDTLDKNAFKDFLEDFADDKSEYAERYQKGLSSLNGVTHNENLLEMCKAFEYFQEGGVNSKDEYEEAIKMSKNFYAQ